MNWATDEFEKADKKREADRKRAAALKERARLEKERKMKESELTPYLGAKPEPEKESWYQMVKRALFASKDVTTKDTTTTTEDELDYNKSGVVTGEVTYKVPDTMRALRVRVLESNGRLKNQYALSRYIDIRPGDKIHIIVDE